MEYILSLFSGSLAGDMIFSGLDDSYPLKQSRDLHSP